MIFLRLYWEFFKTGLFAVGGGLATLPFLKEIGERTGWFAYGELLDMLAVSESTPGPIGINMATYVGFSVAGVPGAVIATLGEITPSILVILMVGAMLSRFRSSKLVDRAFYGLRPASAGLIGGAAVAVILEVLLGSEILKAPEALLGRFHWSGAVDGLGIALAVVIWVLTNKVRKTKNLHPIVFIAASAAVGVALGALGI